LYGSPNNIFGAILLWAQPKIKNIWAHTQLEKINREI